MTEILTKPVSQMTEAEFQAWLEMEPEHTEKSEDGQYLHVPIAYLEPDLRATFEGKIEVKIKDVKEMFNSVMLTMTLRVFHPVHKLWLEYDGIAAVVIVLDKPGEYKGSIKTAVLEDMKTGVPSCYSVAIQNAAKKIGKRFGSDLNRLNKPGNGNGKEGKEEVKKKAVDSRVEILINDCKSIAELNELMPTLPSNEEVQKALNIKLKQLKNTKKS